MTYAYTGDLLLPVTITPAPARGGTPIKAHAEWLVCRDICVPEEADFQLDLPAGTGAPSAQAPLFAASDRRAAAPVALAGGGGPRRHLAGSQGPELTPATVVDAWFIPDAPGTIRDNAAQPLTVWHGGFTLALRPGKAFQPAGRRCPASCRCATAPAWKPTWRCARRRGTVPPPPPAMRAAARCWCSPSWAA